MTHWLKAQTQGIPIGVDKDKRVIFGAVIAEEGEFKSKDRGEFDQSAIKQIVKLSRAKPGGLKSRFAHPQLSDDGIGKLLGRARNLSTGFVQRASPEGPKEVMLARGDIYFKDHASKTPDGDLAGYVMDVVTEAIRDNTLDDIGMSLVLETEQEFRLDKKGRPKTDDSGRELPPLWRPTALHAIDFVGEGDATNSILAAGLSIDGLPDDVLHKATELLRAQFEGKSREFVQQHLSDWMLRALDCYWPVDELDDELDSVESRALALSLKRRPFSRASR